MEECDPARLLAQVLQDWVAFLGEDPDAYVGLAARERQLWQHLFLLRQSLRGHAVVDYKKCWLALKHQVEGPQVIVKALTGVQNVDLRVRPEPGALLVGLVVLYGGAQDHDVSKEPPVGAFFEHRQDENGFPHPVCPQTIAEWAPLGRRWLINSWDEPAIFEVQLGVHDDVQIDVQSAGRLCRLSQLDGHSFARIHYAAATAMKQVIIGCPEVKSQSELGGQELPERDVSETKVFRHHCHFGEAFAAGCK